MEKKLAKNASKKQRGSALLLAVLLSGLMLTIGLSATQMLLKEITASADLMMSEKAYFSAEAGVEKSLLWLRNNPIEHLEDHTENIGPEAEVNINIINRINAVPGDAIPNAFTFTLNPLQNQKFRLQVDQDENLGVNVQPINNLKLDITPESGSPKFNWKILCKDSAGKTLALQKTETSNPAGNNFLNKIGNLDDGGTTNFNGWSGIDKTTCFFSIQNLATASAEFRFYESPTAPHKATVTTIGKSGNRQKITAFDYAQKNLGSLFDFGILHTEQGL